MNEKSEKGEMVATTKSQTTEIEAATFRRLLDHLDKNKDVQNIDLMILANFCRNCISKWYASEAQQRGVDIDYEQARNVVYGMPYDKWKDQHQKPASAEQLAAMEKRKK